MSGTNDEAPSNAAHWHSRAQAAETEARTLRCRYAVVSGWIVEALKVLDTVDPDDTDEAERLAKLVKAGEVLALTTLANSKTPNKPLRRSVDGVCTRSTCECERDGLGDQCVWLKPAAAEFECLGEPSLCANPRGCACFQAGRTDRPSTPVGWSDTDWLKHLEDIRRDQAVYHRGPLPETGWD